MTDSMNIHNAPHLDRMFCIPCNGTGKVFEEHADGHLSEHVCPYCHGAKNSVWVRDKFDERQSRLSTVRWCILAYWVGVIFCADAYWGVNVMIPLGSWAVGIVGLVWLWVHPRPSHRRQRKLAHPDPMTTDRERLMGTALAAGAAFKTTWQANRRNR